MHCSKCGKCKNWYYNYCKMNVEQSDIINDDCFEFESDVESQHFGTQEVTYALSLIDFEINETASMYDSNGNRLRFSTDVFFEKTFKSAHERYAFERAAENYLSRIDKSEIEKDEAYKARIIQEFLRNVLLTENKFGLKI